MFRCPTCIAVLAEPRARRCDTCGQNLRRREPFVLGDAAKVSSRQLPIDRWMADRVKRQPGSTFRSASAPTQPARPTLTLAPTIVEAPVEAPVEVLFEFEPTIAPTVRPKPTIVPAPVVAPVVAPVFAPEPEPEPILEPVAETVVEAPTPVEPILEPAIEPAIEPEAKPAFGGFYSRRPGVDNEVKHSAEPIAAPTPPATPVIEPPIEMTALPVEVVEPVEQIVAPELFSAVSDMIAPFLEAPLHEPRLHRAAEVVEQAAEPETAVAEPSMLVFAVGGEP
ncbi:MAG: hypothetical protein QOI55_2855, partial [Actinomycetota bacterium]|nr:hypothetical protein [Actinomycetota bacterium]